MNTTRQVARLLCIAVIAFALTACGDSAENNETTTVPPTTAPPTTEPRADDGGAAQPTSPPEQEPSGVSGDLTVGGQSLSLESGCVNTFDPSGTGRVTAQFAASDGTTLEIVAFPDEDPTVTIVQDGRIWSDTRDAPFTVEVDAEAGRATGRGSLVEGRTTANSDPDDTPVAVEFSATWDAANPCP